MNNFFSLNKKLIFNTDYTGKPVVSALDSDGLFLFYAQCLICVACLSLRELRATGCAAVRKTGSAEALAHFSNSVHRLL